MNIRVSNRLNLHLGPRYSGVADPFAGFTPVMVVAGDSNAIGGPATARSTYTPTTDITMWNGATGAFVTYTPGTVAGMTDSTSTLPNWSSEAQAIENFKAAFPGKKLRLIKAGHSGTTLNGHWKPTAQYYTEMTTRITNALAAVTAEGGLPPKIFLLIMHCATNDANDVTAAGNFQANMISFLNNVRTDWQIPATTPIAWVRQKPFDTTPYWSTVKSAMNTVAGSYQYLKLINADDAPVDSDGDIHFGQWGHNLIGARAYGAMRGTYTLSELSGPSIWNPNFDAGIDYWSGYNGTVTPTWDATGKLAFPATLNGEVTGWTAGTVPGTYYLVTYTAANNGSDFSIAGAKNIGTANSGNRQINQLGRTGTVGFRASNSSNSIDILRTATTAGASTFDSFTLAAVASTGSNVITNSSPWVATGWTFTGASISAGNLVVTGSGGGTIAVRTTGVTTVSGGVYKLTLVVSAYTSGGLTFYMDGDGASTNMTNGGAAYGKAVATTEFVVHANGAFNSFYIQGDFIGTIDSVTLQQLS